MKKVLNGFTLSETLIVVVVLGIIATLTIPALVNKNKEYETDDGGGYTCVSFAFSGEIEDGDCGDKGGVFYDVPKVLCLRDN